jgi:nuclear RNA export factor
VRRFPSLKILDGNTLGPLVKGISFGIDTAAKPATSSVPLPAKIQQGAWDEGSRDIGVGFLGVFFPLYDTDRQSLVQQYYTPTTLFSLSVDTTTPHLPTMQQRRGAFSGANQPPQSASLGGYIPQSRNLQRTTTINARVTRLHHGRDQISQAFMNLPRTKHPLEDPSAFIADGFQVQIGSSGGIMVSVHGEFTEYSDRGGKSKRSFDRTFLLGPPAATNPGAQCVVVSDLLVLRPYSGRDAWVAEEDGSTGLVGEMRRRTGLNEHFAKLLLEECKGDVEAGFRRFEEAKVIDP